VFGASRMDHQAPEGMNDAVTDHHTDDDVDHTVERPITHRPTSQRSLRGPLTAGTTC
jgi:hypothetical protein